MKLAVQSVLFGNGINRLSPGTPSWSDLLKDVSSVVLDQEIPNTLKYEVLVLNKPDGESGLKEELAKRMKLFDTNDTYKMLSNLKVDHFLTTNYDNTILKALGRKSFDSRYRPERLYSIRRRYKLDFPLDDYEVDYWPIHGNVDSPQSIMLGFDQYCGSLSRIERYIKGNFEIDGNTIPSMTSRLNHPDFEVNSWIDLFYMSDVHIIGFGMEYDEIDLWWILNARRRLMQKDSSLVKNRILYYPVTRVGADKKQLLDSFKVEIVEPASYHDSFMDRYKKQIKKIDLYITA